MSMAQTRTRSWSRRRGMALGVAIALLMTACGGNDTADDGNGGAATDNGTGADNGDVEFEEVTLTYSSFTDRENPHGLAHRWWAEQVTERTDGAVTFEEHYDSSLCDDAEGRFCVEDGRADIAFSTPLYNPAETPIANIVSIMFLSDNNEALTRAMNDLYDQTPALQEEYEALNSRLLYFAPVNIPLLFTNFTMDGIDDMSGRSIRAIGDMPPALEAMGASPVSISNAEYYESMQRGVIDGIAGTLDSIVSWNVYEVIDAAYNLGEYTGSYALMDTMINLDTWNSLQPEVQEIMNETTDELIEIMVEEFHVPVENRDCETLVENVDVVEPLPDADEWESWADEWGDTAIESWVSSAEEAGTDNAREIADQYMQLVQKYEGETEYTPAGARCIEMAD